MRRQRTEHALCAMTLTPPLDGSHRIPYDCDLTRDPGAPMTAPAPAPDLTEFRLWLETTRGLGRRTTFTAVSQVRRVLRDCGPQVSEASLRAWHDERPSHLRTPVVSNWRRYREWWATKGIPGIPDFPRRPGAAPQRAPIPDTVCVGARCTPPCWPAHRDSRRGRSPRSTRRPESLPSPRPPSHRSWHGATTALRSSTRPSCRPSPVATPQCQ